MLNWEVPAILKITYWTTVNMPQQEYWKIDQSGRWERGRKAMKRKGERGRSIDCSSDLSQHTKPPLLLKKTPSAARTFYCINCSPRPLSRPPLTVGQPMSWNRGLKAPAGQATIGLLERKGKCSFSLTFFIANSLSLSLFLPFTIGRHYWSHYSDPPSCHRSLATQIWCVLASVRAHEPCGMPSNPTEREMRRIKNNFSLTVLTFPLPAIQTTVTHFACLLDTLWYACTCTV